MESKVVVGFKKNGDFNSQGFTILELLVVTAILGILIGIASSVFIGVLRSQNKTQVTNEARQNAAIVIDLFERDIRPAQSVVATAPNILEINYRNKTIVWTCNNASSGNGQFTRLDAGNLEVLTNTDASSGVNIRCDNGATASPTNDVFATTGTAGVQQIVLFAFTVEQGVGAPTRNDYQINIPFETTVGTRSF